MAVKDEEDQEESLDLELGLNLLFVERKEENLDLRLRLDHLLLDDTEQEGDRKEDEDEEDEDTEEEEEEDDDDELEMMTLPLVTSWIDPADGSRVKGLEVPVMKEDDFIHHSMYRDDIVYGPKKDPPSHIFDTNDILAPADICPICHMDWTSVHQFCCLPCGHIFGESCINILIQNKSQVRCPQCNTLFSSRNVRPLHATPLCIPAMDQKTSARRFPLSRFGLLAFNTFEIGRRNFALKKRSEVKKRLAGVVRRKKDLMNRWTHLRERMNTLEGDSFCQAGKLADKYLRRAKAWEGRAKALSQRIKAYDERVKAFKERMRFFAKNYKELD